MLKLWLKIDIEVKNTKKLELIGFNDDKTWEMRKKYPENKVSYVLDLYEKHIDDIKFAKPWIENALKENYIENTAYKKQLIIKENRFDKLSKKLNKIALKLVNYVAVILCVFRIIIILMMLLLN